MALVFQISSAATTTILRVIKVTTGGGGIRPIEGKMFPRGTK